MRYFAIGRFFVLLTLIIGAYIHLCNLFFGTDLLLKHLLTPFVDSLFAIPMVIGGFAVVLARKEIYYRNKFEKFVVYFTAIYFIVSMPLHVQTLISQSTELFRVFPVWYSAIFLGYSSVIQWVWWRLEAEANLRLSA